MPPDQSPVIGEELIGYWTGVAQGGGKPSIEEMVETLDSMIALRDGAARAYVKLKGDNAIPDWQRWGREAYVLSYILDRLKSWQTKGQAR